MKKIIFILLFGVLTTSLIAQSLTRTMPTGWSDTELLMPKFIPDNTTPIKTAKSFFLVL